MNGLPRSLARFNRVVTNRVTKPFAAWLPGFGVVEHVGRSSHRAYRTPVNVFRASGGYVVVLTYGASTDWVKNVIAAGGCNLVSRGRRVTLRAPDVFHDESRGAVPSVVRLILRAIGVADFMRLSTA